MKVSKEFEITIQKFLNKKAETDSVFKEKLTNDKFKIEDCVNYILTTVQKSGVNGYTDDEVFNMGIHYVDEYLSKTFDINDGIKMQVVVNHTVKLTEAEIEEAKDKAKEKILDEARKKMTKKPKKAAMKTVKLDRETKNKPAQSALIF